jgi:hypothetical protein
MEKMRLKNFLPILIFLFSFETAFAQKPKISLSFPENFRANEEIEISISASDLKNLPYDLKISIEKEKVLSEIYNEKEERWQSSLYYLKNLFLGPSFEGKLKLRMKKEFLFFEGEADIVARVRESGKSAFVENREKIKILKPEIESKNIQNLASISQNLEKNPHFSPKIIAILTAIFSAITILVLKLKISQK